MTAFKTQQFYSTQNLYRTRKSKNFQRKCLFSFSFKSFQLFESNVLSHFLYFCFISRALTSLIIPMGITGKSGPEYLPITGRIIYFQALGIHCQKVSVARNKLIFWRTTQHFLVSKTCFGIPDAILSWRKKLQQSYLYATYPLGKAHFKSTG